MRPLKEAEGRAQYGDDRRFWGDTNTSATNLFLVIHLATPNQYQILLASIFLTSPPDKVCVFRLSGTLHRN